MQIGTVCVEFGFNYPVCGLYHTNCILIDCVVVDTIHYFEIEADTATEYKQALSKTMETIATAQSVT